jgi:hypothetical protein
MGVFSFSDLIIGVTLLFNALALLSHKPKNFNQIKTTTSQAELIPLTSADGDNHDSESANPSSTTTDEGSSTPTSIYERLVLSMMTIRKLSCCIVLWNIFFAVLMVFVFRG